MKNPSSRFGRRVINQSPSSDRLSILKANDLVILARVAFLHFVLANPGFAFEAPAEETPKNQPATVVGNSSVNSTNLQIDLLPFIRGEDAPAPTKEYLLIVHGGTFEADPPATSTNDFSPVIRGANGGTATFQDIFTTHRGTNTTTARSNHARKLTRAKSIPEPTREKAPAPQQHLSRLQIISLIIIVVSFLGFIVCLHLYRKRYHEQQLRKPHIAKLRLEMSKTRWATTIALLTILLTVVGIVLKMMGMNLM